MFVYSKRRLKRKVNPWWTAETIFPFSFFFFWKESFKRRNQAEIGNLFLAYGFSASIQRGWHAEAARQGRKEDLFFFQTLKMERSSIALHFFSFSVQIFLFLFCISKPVQQIRLFLVRALAGNIFSMFVNKRTSYTIELSSSKMCHIFFLITLQSIKSIISRFLLWIRAPLVWSTSLTLQF